MGNFKFYILWQTIKLKLYTPFSSTPGPLLDGFSHGEVAT